MIYRSCVLWFHFLLISVVAWLMKKFTNIKKSRIVDVADVAPMKINEFHKNPDIGKYVIAANAANRDKASLSFILLPCVF